MEVDKVADMVADMEVDININMEIQFRERVGHGGWLIGPKLFRPEAYPATTTTTLLHSYPLPHVLAARSYAASSERETSLG